MSGPLWPGGMHSPWRMAAPMASAVAPGAEGMRTAVLLLKPYELHHGRAIWFGNFGSVQILGCQTRIFLGHTCVPFQPIVAQ